MSDPRRIEYRPLSSITPAPRNVKKHDIGVLVQSIQRFGFNDAAIIDERTSKLVSGHGRVAALRQMRQAKAPAPAGVRANGDDWWVPVQLGWSSKDDVEAEAFLVAANRIVELGGYDEPVLEVVLRELAAADALGGTGFDQEGVDRIINEANRKRDGATDVDDIPEVRDAGGVKLGDLFRLGDHLLLCGDSTKALDVDRVLQGGPHQATDEVDAMWTDPPYGVDYESNGRKKQVGKVLNDGKAGLPGLLESVFAQAFRVLKPGAFVYIAHPSGPNALVFYDEVARAGFAFKAGHRARPGLRESHHRSLGGLHAA